MYCALCVYFTEQEECLLRSKISPEQQKAGCDDFIERSLRIAGSGGCCGISGLPSFDPPNKGESGK
jgi:hypothetical protein